MKTIQQIRTPKQAKAAQRVAEKARVNPAAVLKGTQAFVQEPVTVHSAESELDLAHSDFVRARDRLLDAAGFGKTSRWPQWMRTACAYLTAFCIGYGIGTLLGVLLEMVAAAGISGAAFVLIYVIGFVIAVVLAYKLSRYVGDAIASGAVDQYVATKYVAAKNFIGAIFDRKDIELGGQHA